MILLSTSELAAGTYTATDLHDENNRLLLKGGSLLTDKHVELLQSRKVQSVYVEKEGTEDICPKDVVAPELRTECQTALARAMKGLSRQAEARQIAIDTQVIHELTTGLVEELFSSKVNLVTMLDIRDWDNRLYQHSVNTAVLAILLAKSMKFSEEDCKSLAMGMMFHDCGQLLLPREVFEKSGDLTPEERAVANKHARMGFKRMVHAAAMPSMSAYVILRHHERVDGTGYPDNIGGDDLHPLARIACVVEAFDAMTSLRPYRKTMMPDQAVCEILRQSGTAFDQQVALALARHIAIYPVGSAVQLNTGETGFVVSTPSGNTTRPVVRLFYGPDGRRQQLEDVDLTKDRSRLVARSGVSMDVLKKRRTAWRTEAPRSRAA